MWLLVTLGAVALGAVLLAPALDGLHAVEGGEVGSAGFSAVLVWLCAAVAMGVTCWLWLGATAVVVDVWRGRVKPRRGVPAALRGATLALCGVALTTALPGQALGAAPGGHPEPPLLSGLRLPERVAVSQVSGGDSTAPTRTDRLPPSAARATPVTARDTVVVEAGDTLWQLMAAHLGPGATDEEVARAWPELYALNRDRIGPDPGLIQPGQRLILPTGGGDHEVGR